MHPSSNRTQPPKNIQFKKVSGLSLFADKFLAMAMGGRQLRERQEDLWVAHRELATAPGLPFYERLNTVLDAEGFDRFVEDLCAKFYAPQSVIRL